MRRGSADARALFANWARLAPVALIALAMSGAACGVRSARGTTTGYRTPGDPRATLDAGEARAVIGPARAGADVTPASWPGDRRVAVALTFDLDAELVWIGDPDRVSPSELSRGQYGPRVGLERILLLLERRQVPATFFLPALMLELYPDAVAAIRASGRHEIGYHGYAHESVAALSPEEERDAMMRGLALFRKAGIEPVVYRSPSWDFSRATLSILEDFGFRFDSSLMADDRPYELLADGRATGVIELPVDWSLDDWPYFQTDWQLPLAGLRSTSEVLEIWKAEFDVARREGGLFILTMHPQVIGRRSRVAMLEDLIEHIDRSGDAWYATLGEIGKHIVGARVR